MYKYTIQVPPIRTPLTEMDLAGSALAGNAPQPTNTNGAAGTGSGTNQPPRTAKEWYRFWQQSGAQINSNSNLVTQGSHAARPDPANTPDGALYCETDRGGVLYQLRNGQWWYVAGTMFDHLNPDNRPTDLGDTDGGFTFRSTDTAVPYEYREFIWSQTAWVDTSASNYLVDGAVIATRPTLNLISGANTEISGADDPGFNRVDVTITATVPAAVTGDAQFAAASASLTLATALQDVPGASIAVNRAGLYWIHGIFDFNLQGAGDIGFIFVGQLNAAGSSVQGNIALFAPANVAAGSPIGRVTIAQQWLFQASAAGQIVKLQAYKGGGTGSSNVVAGNTTISAIWIKS